MGITCYRYGRGGVPQDYDKAKAYYEQAASLGGCLWVPYAVLEIYKSGWIWSNARFCQGTRVLRTSCRKGRASRGTL